MCKFKDYNIEKRVQIGCIDMLSSMKIEVMMKTYMKQGKKQKQIVCERISDTKWFSIS